MPKYVILFKYKGPTEGAGPERFAKARQLVAEENGEILQLYGLLGAYDVLWLVECPDNQAAMKIAVKIGNLANASTQTMPAVEGDEFLQLLKEL